MVTEFNGFDKGVIGKKLPSDTTLNNMEKAELIELLHIAEHNHSTLAWFYKNACDNSKCNRCPLMDSRKQGYNKAIEDFVEKLANNVESFKGEVNGVRANLMTEDYFHEYIWEIAEQMKGV